MTRSLSAAGTLAILCLALWIGQMARSTVPVVAASAHAADAPAAAAPPSTDIAATAIDDLAGWPVAAGR
jgi:hypothetical protein